MASKFTQAVLVFTLINGVIMPSHGDTQDNPVEKLTSHKMVHTSEDTRISLALSAPMKQHQMANMRSHLAAVQAIVDLMAKGEFDQASAIAHNKLGLTEEMKNMCEMVGNKEFSDLGLSFHKSADVLGDVLRTKDINKSLNALNKTLGYCTQCHATFRQ